MGKNVQTFCDQFKHLCGDIRYKKTKENLKSQGIARLDLKRMSSTYVQA
jgi:hypothetical protein